MQVQSFLNARIKRPAGAPIFWAYLANGGMTDPSGGAGRDVFDVAGKMVGTRQGGSTWTNGLDGYCLAFDGSTGYVDLGNASTINPTGACTVASWLYFNTVPTGGGEAHAFSRDDGSLGRSFGTSYQSFGGNGWCWQINGGNKIVSSVTASAGLWYHYAASGSPALGWTLYINAALVGTGTWTAPASTTGPTRIGARSFVGSMDFWPGLIKDARIYNYALGAPDIARDYADPFYWSRNPIGDTEIVPYLPASPALWPGWFTNPAMSSFDAMGL